MKMSNLRNLLCVALIFCGTAAIAQPQRAERRADCKRELSTEESVQKRCDKIAEELGLNDKQRSELLKINTNYANRRKLQSEEHKAEREKQREQIRAQREVHLGEIMALLSDKQKVKYAAMLSEKGRQNGLKEGRRKPAKR